MRNGGIVVLAAIAGMTAFAPAIQAQESPTSEEAHRLFREGNALAGQERYREALARFRASAAIEEHGGTAYNIARCLHRLNRWCDAVDAYDRFLTRFPNHRHVGDARDYRSELGSQCRTRSRGPLWLGIAGGVTASVGIAMGVLMIVDRAAIRGAEVGEPWLDYADRFDRQRRAGIAMGVLLTAGVGLSLGALRWWSGAQMETARVRLQIGPTGISGSF